MNIVINNSFIPKSSGSDKVTNLEVDPVVSSTRQYLELSSLETPCLGSSETLSSRIQQGNIFSLESAQENLRLKNVQIEPNEDPNFYLKPWSKMSVKERIELVTMGTIFGVPYAAYKGVCYSLTHIYESIKHLIHQISDRIQKIIDGAVIVFEKTIEYGHAIGEYIFDHLLKPIYEALQSLLEWFYEQVLTPIGQWMQTVFNMLVDGIMKGLNALWSVVQKMAIKVQESAKWGYDNILTPIGHIMISVFTTIMDSLQIVGNKIYGFALRSYEAITNFVNRVIQKGCSSVGIINDYILQPFYERGCVAMNTVNESVVIPTFKKSDYFVREYIPQMLEHAQQTLRTGMERMQRSAWKATHYFSVIFSQKVA